MKVAKWKDTLTPELCRIFLEYDPENGTLTWNTRSVEWFSGDERACKTWNTRFSNQKIPLKPIKRKYVTTCQTTTVLGYRIDPAILAWIIFYGEYPSGYITRQNGMHCDIRIANLASGKGAIPPVGYFDE